MCLCTIRSLSRYEQKRHGKKTRYLIAGYQIKQTQVYST